MSEMLIPISSAMLVRVSTLGMRCLCRMRCSPLGVSRQRRAISDAEIFLLDMYVFSACATFSRSRSMISPCFNTLVIMLAQDLTTVNTKVR